MTDYCTCDHAVAEYAKGKWFCASCFALVKPDEQPFKTEGGERQ